MGVQHAAGARTGGGVQGGAGLRAAHRGLGSLRDEIAAAHESSRNTVIDTQHQESLQAADFRRHMDQYYLGVIHRLLNEDGIFLAFVSMLTAVEALAGVYQPGMNAGPRFRAFLKEFFPAAYHPLVRELWAFRNKMVHSFNPGPFSLVCHASRMHLIVVNDARVLNAEDFYSDLVVASRAYFARLYADLDLQKRFSDRLAQDDGGAMKFETIKEEVRPREPAR